MRFSAPSLLLALVSVFGSAQVARIDPNLPSYKPPVGFTGTVNLVGSDNLESIVHQWFGQFRKYHPDVTLKVSSEGSTAGVLALLEGESLIATMSREMSKSEVMSFQSKFGYPPTRVVIGLDALGVFVHPSNPIQALSLEQLDAMFSTTRKQGARDSITTWGGLGVTGEMANRRIMMYGRDENAGPRVFFRDKVLLKGEFRPGIPALEDSSSVVEGVSLSPGAIGYAPVSEITSFVKLVPIMVGGAKVTPTLDTIMKSDYPLTHFLYLYVNKAPGRPLPPAVQGFLTFAFSKEGQTSVATSGLPIPADVAKAMLNKIQ
ncbi:PstS family phosphate ABC transporter substrate-binding protein [Holophaga foetida]|uniref:PstS family phosphate ABC transporter substrate-binding protein n=1 Tax=Holophaga foetida TaxID=35839 RepID=UPI000247537E|nr:phosphate ABC transporter substrate-binding protein [Holophaga foetida]